MQGNPRLPVPSLFTVLERVPDGVALANPEGRVFFFNRAAKEILGVGPSRKPPDQWARHYGVYKPDGSPFPLEDYPILRALRGEEPDDVPILIRNESVPDGRLISVTGRALTDFDGTVVAASAVFRTIREGATSPSGHTILVIEDDPKVRQTVVRFLAVGGYTTLEAEDGARGFQAFLRRRPDLIITDIVMPTREGIETIELIRELDATVPIIAISGSGTDEYSPLVDAELMGADVAIGKPFTMEALLGAVREQLATSRPVRPGSVGSVPAGTASVTRQVRDWKAPDGTVYRLVLAMPPAYLSKSHDRRRILTFERRADPRAPTNVRMVPPDFDLHSASDDALAAILQRR